MFLHLWINPQNGGLIHISREKIRQKERDNFGGRPPGSLMVVGDMGGLVVKVNVVMSYSMTNGCIRKETVFRIIYRKCKKWRKKGALVFVCVEPTTKIASPLSNRQ